MAKYHVHVYATVRVKVWNVEAESQEAATQVAYDAAVDDVLAKLPDRVRHDPPGDGVVAEFAGYAEDVTGFLVDEDGDTEYRNSRDYDGAGKPLPPITVGDVIGQPATVNRFGELYLPLASGGTLCCGPSSEGSMYGGDVRIRDAEGNEVVMWASTEWEEAPEEVMGAIFGAAKIELPQLLETLKRTHVEGECWV